MKNSLEKFQKYMMFWVLCIIAVCAIFLFVNEITKNRKPQVVFLDVGQGDAIFITAPNGRQVLIDAGKYPDISTKIAKYMSMSDRSLDMIIATHPDIDHVAGFDALLDEYDIGMFAHSGLLSGASVYRSIAKKVRKNNIQTHTAIAGDNIYLDKNMYLEILSPYFGQKIENPNDHSVVVRLVYNNHGIMLTGDASKLVEQNLVSMYGEIGLRSDILKMGHHGSKTSSDENFVKMINPEYGIISAGCDNQFGHPHASVLRVLDENNITELNTCENGDIVFEFKNDGWVLEK